MGPITRLVDPRADRASRGGDMHAAPGQIVRSQDGRTFYQVQADGSWRRVQLVGGKRKKSA